MQPDFTRLHPSIERLRARVAPIQQAGADACHDIHHVDRVAMNAQRLAHAAGADVDVVVAAAYVHDLDRAGSESPLKDAEALLVDAGFPADRLDAALECCRRVSDYSFKPAGKKPTTLEARVLQDADKLEAIGAIGVARTFSFGGMLARAMFDGSPPIEDRPYDKTKGGDEHTIQHFHDKLLRLTPEEFNTAAGKRAAAVRQARLRVFLDEFNAEAEARDLPDLPHS